MEESHRKVIKKNIISLQRLTNYDQLIKLCVQNKLIFTDGMLQQIEVSSSLFIICSLKNINPFQNLEPNKRHEALLEKITHRGPRAFDIFARICEVHFPVAASLLLDDNEISLKYIRTNNGRSTQQQQQQQTPSTVPNHQSTEDDHVVVVVDDDVDTCGSRLTPADFANRRLINNNNNTRSHDAHHHSPPVFKPYTEPLDGPTLYPVKLSNQIHIHEKSCYSMESNYRGVAFIVNIVNFNTTNEDRSGALRDKHNLIWLFRDMGFEVFYYQDITAKVRQFIFLHNQLCIYLFFFFRNRK